MHSDSPTLGRVLVAVDFSPSSQAALLQAIQLAPQSDGPVEVLHVAQSDVEAARLTMQDFLSTIAVPPDVALAVRFETGEPASTIVKVAGMEAHDLIILGAHGLSKRWSVRLGEVAEQVVRHASCPVVTVQTGGAEAVLPWLPRDTQSTQRVSLESPATTPLSKVLFHCPQTGIQTSAGECLRCPRLVAGSVTAGAFELICRRGH